MKIYAKILLTTLPLVFLSFLAGTTITQLLSRKALNSLAEEWLETRMSEAEEMASEQVEVLRTFALDTVEASVKQAQRDSQREMASIDIGQAGYIYVVSEDGVVEAHPDESMVGARVSDSEWFGRIRDTRAGRIHYDMRGERHFATYRYFAPWGWYIIATDPESEVYGAANAMQLYGGLVALGGSLVVAVALMLLTRRVTAPLRSLVAGAEEVGRGNLDTNIAIETRDEIAVLARAFNQMTQRLKAQYESLEMRLGTVVSSAPIILFSLDEEGRFTLLEGRGLEALTLDSRQLLGNSIADLCPNDESILSDVQRALGGVTVHSYLEIQDLTFETWLSPLRDAAGAPAGILAVATDVTERQQAQERLRRQNEYLAALNETTLGLVSRLEVSDLLEALLSRAAHLLSTRHGYIYLADPGTERIERKVGVGVYRDSVGFRLEPGEGVAGRVWESGEPMVVNDYQSWQGRVMAADYVVPVRALMAAPLKSGESVIGVLGVAYDTSSDRLFGDEEIELLNRFAQLASISLDNARLYTAAQEARQVADAANEAKSAFLANVSHELRTPLTSILGFARLIQKRFSDRIQPELQDRGKKVDRAIEQVNSNLEIILAEGARLTALINNVLDLEKIEAGKMTWDIRATDIAEVIEQAVSSTAGMYDQKGLPLEVRLTSDLPDVLADKDKLVQVLVNLLSNAVKFTDQGEVRCDAACDGTGNVVVRVIDTGYGISPEDRDTVFEKFRQVGDTLTDKPHGTGLGLAICKEIVEHLGGKIWLDSEHGKGSTFSFSVPVAA